MSIDWGDEAVRRGHHEMLQSIQDWQTAQEDHGPFLSADSCVRGRCLEVRDIEEWREHYLALKAAEDAYHTARQRFLEVADVRPAAAEGTVEGQLWEV
jgi:hypothetical protein